MDPVAGTEAEIPCSDGSTAKALALEIRHRRTAAGLSQTELADRVGFSREYVSRAERSSRGVPSQYLIELLDGALGAGGALVALRDAAVGERQARQGALVRRTPSEVATAGREDVVGDGAEGGRHTTAGVLAVLESDEALDMVEEFTRSVIERYEIEGPSLLMPEVRALREVCRAVMPRVGPGLRARVARMSGCQAGLLAYMSVNLGREHDAEVFGLEAAMFATVAKDRDLLAWVKGTQSFAAYYQGRYSDALRHARAGLHVGAGGGQRARLLSNGVARAAGKLGQLAVVERAVGQALELAEPTGPDGGLGPCIGFAPYGQARTMSNAATAYLSAGKYEAVLEMTGQLDDTVTRSDSDWSRALVGLDTASALARGDGLDLDHAAEVGLGALTDSRSNPIASIRRRAGELADDLSGRGHRSSSQFRDALRDWPGIPGSRE